MALGFSTAFLAGDERAAGFLARDFRDRDARVARAREASGGRVASELIGVLRDQDAALPPSPARRANIDALATTGTVAVVTGQQVGLFLGPLYTFYKAASVVATAAALERESGVRCVPVFWLQTEDHDFAEIQSCAVAGPDGETVRVAIAPEPGTAARASVRHRRLGPDVQAALDVAAQALAPQPHAAEVVALIRTHYVPGRSLAAAFAGLLASLFADDGLVLFDPRDAAVARLAAPLYRRALADAPAISTRLAERGAALAAAGFDEQVHVRPGCSLVCFHEGDAAGSRFRLERTDAGWRPTGGARVVSDTELFETLERDPLRFSTTALLRPLVQDALLPVAATVGGPGEVSYFAQLGPLYDLFGLPQPLIVPRARFRLLDGKTGARLGKLGLRAQDVERPWTDLVRAAAARTAVASAGGGAADQDPERLSSAVTVAVLRALEPLERAAAAADANLARPAERTRQTVARAVHRLADKLSRARVEKDAVTMRRLERLRAALFPEGAPQERVIGWPSPAARVGIAAFARLVETTLVPFSADVREIAL